MTDGINRISGGNSYSVGGYLHRSKGEETPQNEVAKAPVNNYEETQMDPSKVMDYLAANNFFVAPAKEAAPAGQVDLVTQDRIANSMKDFELFMSVASEEVGEDLALLLADEYSLKM